MPLLRTDRAVRTSPLTLITADEARALGIRPSAPVFRRLQPGVWVDTSDYLALPPWLRYAARVHAFARRHPSAILCLESAAVLAGLPLFGHPRHIHVYDPALTASRTIHDVQFHASVDARDVVTIGGIPTTSMLDTALDLARVLPPAHALAVTDAAVSPAQGGTVAVSEIDERAAFQSNRRGRARVRWVLAHTDGRSESAGESVSRAVIDWSGYEPPTLQREFPHDGGVDRVDFFFAAARVVGESDGWGKYELDDPAAAAAHLRDEKRRENRLRAGGNTVARWEMRDALRVVPLCTALHQAGLAPVRPAQHAMLATLKSSPRSFASHRPTQPTSPR